MMDDADKKRRWLEHHRRCKLIDQEYQRRGILCSWLHHPPMPRDLFDIRCGAKTKAGTPCKLTAIYANGRCKWHGGLSTGPNTEQGKEQARINGRKGGRPRKPKP